MRGASETAFSRRTAQYGADEYMQPQRTGGARIQLIVAILGLGSLAFMLWTMARMLNLIPG